MVGHFLCNKGVLLNVSFFLLSLQGNLAMQIILFFFKNTLSSTRNSTNRPYYLIENLAIRENNKGIRGIECKMLLLRLLRKIRVLWQKQSARLKFINQ